MMHLDDVAMNIRQDRRRPADRDEPEDQEMQGKSSELRAVHRQPSFHAAMIANGASAAITQSSGNRNTPTARKAIATNVQGSHWRGKTDMNLITVASNSPAATLDIPVSAR